MTDLHSLHHSLRAAKLAREDLTAHIHDLQDQITSAARQPDQEPDWYLGDGVTEPATKRETALLTGIPVGIMACVGLLIAWWLS